MVRPLVQHTDDFRELRLLRAIPAPTPPARAAALELLAAEWSDHDGYFPCEVGSDRELTTGHAAAPERFTALQIGLLLDPRARPGHELTSGLALLVARRCAAETRSGELVHFFHDAKKLPADADCTALAYLLALRAGLDLEAQAHRAFDRIAANVGREGVVATYFDCSTDRAGIIDAVVAANVVRLAVRLGRAAEVRATSAFLEGLIRDKSYLAGSRYYPSPDCLLYSLALGAPVPGLREAVAARIGTSDATIDLAQRVLAARRLGLINTIDRDRLLAKAGADGTWSREGWFCFGRSRHWFGSRALSTAFALAAVSGT